MTIIGGLPPLPRIPPTFVRVSSAFFMNTPYYCQGFWPYSLHTPYYCQGFRPYSLQTLYYCRGFKPDSLTNSLLLSGVHPPLPQIPPTIIRASSPQPKNHAQKGRDFHLHNLHYLYQYQAPRKECRQGKQGRDNDQFGRESRFHLVFFGQDAGGRAGRHGR